MRRAVVAGIIWGSFCGLANGWPGATTLVQMAVPWVSLAAFVGFRTADSGSQPALAGGVSLLATNVAYFGVGSIARAFAGLPQIGGVQFFVFWTVVGLVVGPIAGLVGWWLKADRTARMAAALLTTVSIAEPLALWAHIDHLDAHLVYVAVGLGGVALPFARFRRNPRTAFVALALAILLAYPAAVALEAALIALGQVSPPMRLI